MRDGITGTNLAWFIVAVGTGRGLGFGRGAVHLFFLISGSGWAGPLQLFSCFSGLDGPVHLFMLIANLDGSKNASWHKSIHLFRRYCKSAGSKNA